MTQAGYAGNPRYNVVPAAFACVLAGAGVTAVAARLAGGARRPEDRSELHAAAAAPNGVHAAAAAPGDPRPAAAALAVFLAVATLAFTAGDLSDQAGELDDRADRRTQLDALVDAAGGAVAIRACAPPRTNQPMKAMVAWRLDVPMEHLAEPPRPPAIVLAAPPGYAGEPPEPDARGLPVVARAGEWALHAACRDGRPLTSG